MLRVITNLSFVVICVYVCLWLRWGLDQIFYLHASFISPITRVGHGGATLALGPWAGLYCNTCFACKALEGVGKGRGLHLFPSALAQE